LNKKKGRGSDKKKDAGSPDDVQHTEILENGDIDDTKTRQFPQDRVKESIKSRNGDQAEPLEQDEGESAFSFRRIQKKSPYRPLLLILGIVFLIFLALFVVQIIRSHRNTLVLKKATELKATRDNNTTFLESLEQMKSRENPEDMVRQYLFSDDIFQGEAPLGDEGQTIHFSRQQDAELVAIADALNIRVRVLFGIQTAQKEDTITETCNANFHGFRISSLKVSRAEEIIRDEISVSTPSRGLVKITGKSLESVSRITYDQVLKDLETVGLKAYKKMTPDKNGIQIQLRLVGDLPDQTDDAHLIRGKGVGNVTLNSDISEIKSLLAPKYNMIKRRIMVENEFVIIYKIGNQNRKPLFYIYERDSKVWGIHIVDEIFSTVQGLGIGSSLGAMRIYYTRLNVFAIPRKITYLWIDHEDLKEIKFVLADDKRINFDTQHFPFDIKINSILIGKSPYLN
jgi:hypothetical protein